jgi:hypothetical protein
MRLRRSLLQKRLRGLGLPPQSWNPWAKAISTKLIG